MTTNILVAGRSAANVQLVKQAVDLLDYQVIPAPSMSLALFLAQKNLPELIICDMELIDGDPHTFLRELQADAELRPIPFMVLTEKPLSHSENRQFMASGAALVLDKNISPADLLHTIEPYIEARLENKEERPIETPE
jgi:CheY-like chemotaxis protein